MSSAIGAATSLGQAPRRMCAASSASSFEPKKKPASAVTTIRNGNNAIRVDSAIWLAIAHPSSARNCLIDSSTIRNDSLRVRKALSPTRYRSLSEIGYWRVLCKGQPPACRGNTLSGLHVGEELPHFRFKVLRLDRHGIGKVLDVRGGGARVGTHPGDLAHRLGAAARLAGGAADALRDRGHRGVLLVDGRRHHRGNRRHFTNNGVDLFDRARRASGEARSGAESMS